MSSVPSPSSTDRKPPGWHAATAGPALAKAREGGRWVGGRLAPPARRLHARLRGVPAAAKALDGAANAWARLVEAFCQTIEPLLQRRFPDLRLVAGSDGAGSLALHRVEHGKAVALGTFETMTPEVLAGLAAIRWSAVELRLPAAQVLERKLSLPAASRDYLGPILEHRLERLTPWRADKVLYGYSIADEAAPTGSVPVTVTAISRDAVQPMLDRLAGAGLTVGAIGAAAGTPEVPLAVNLLSGGATQAPRAESRRFVSRAALATLGVLLVTLLATTLLAASASADREASALKLTKAHRLLRAATLGSVGSREQALLDAKQPDRSTVVLVDRLSSAIPADTYLKELTVQPDKVRLVGSSNNAPALIAELEAAGLANVRFTSTIARDRAGRDDFELSADRPLPKPEDAP